MMNKVTVRGSPIVNWMYPEIYDNHDVLVLKVYHTRATDPIYIHYDSGRNGFVIQHRGERDGDRVEVAFVPGEDGLPDEEAI
jgi:hypothetical protein